MEVWTLVILALFVVLAFTWLERKKNGNRSLPGPIGLPIVGYLPFMTSKPYIKLTELAKTYGPIYSVRLGSKTIVIICDFQLMKESFVKDEFMGKPNDSVFELHEVTTKTGAVNGLPWKEQKRFCLHMLRDVGLGKTHMEELIKEEIQEVLERFSESVGKPIAPADILAPSMANNVSSVLFGKRLKHDDPKGLQLHNNLKEIVRLAGSLAWQQFFPWIRAITSFFRIGEKAKLSKAFEDLRGYVRNQIPEHQSSLDPNNIQDFMAGYLLEIQKRSEDPLSTFKKEVLVDLSGGFYAAGSGTVQISVEWMLLVCCAFPDVQKKIQHEIDEVLGTDRVASGQDRIRLPYTEAAICELMRWKTIVPLNLMRCTLRDTELRGYFIPKFTEVLGVTWAVDHDESLWGNDVDEYRPERFLSEDGLKVVKPEHFIPFSIGRRSCPGKPLAEVEVFLYLVNILQKFDVSAPFGRKINLEGNLGITLEPMKQELLFKNRNIRN